MAARFCISSGWPVFRAKTPIGVLLLLLSLFPDSFLQIMTDRMLVSKVVVRIWAVVLGPMGRQRSVDAFSHTEGSEMSWWKNSSSLGDWIAR